MTRRWLTIPVEAWVIFGATLVALVGVSIPALASHGGEWFFRGGDSIWYRDVARDLLGDGHLIHGAVGEAAYRYGRPGMPLVAWGVALGQSQWVTWSLIALDLVAIAAVPALCATLLDAYGLPPIGGAFVLLAPGLLLVADRLYLEPFLIAVILVAYIFEARGRRRPAIATLVFAVFVKETAILAIIPFVWRAARKGSFRVAAQWLWCVVPYAVWCVWVRLRVGEFPFFANTPNRTGALRPPFVGMVDAIHDHLPDARVTVLIAVATIVLTLAAAWGARDLPVAGLAAVSALLTACAGRTSLVRQGEMLRLLSVTQVFGIVCWVVIVTRRRSKATREPASLLNAEPGAP